MLAQQQEERGSESTEQALIHKQVTPIKSNLLFEDFRLDAGFYTKDVFIAQQAINKFRTRVLEDYCIRIFMPGRAKRVLTNNAEKGKPLLLPSEFFNFPLRSAKYIQFDLLPNAKDYPVKSDWLMVTRSGVVGLPVFITKKYENFVITDDAIRIVPKTETLYGYIHAYISSAVGQSLLTRNQFGVAVEHIQPHQVKNLPIPEINPELQIVFDKFVKLGNRIRQDAEDLLVEAQNLMHQALRLKPISNVAERAWTAFEVKSSELDMRLDASYQEPYVRQIRKILKEKDAKRIGDSIADVFLPNRFKRTYVEPEFGVPFLQGGNVIQCKLFGLQHISRRMTKNLETLLIRKDWSLVTRSGTVGRACLVPARWDGWAASEHIFRVIPHKHKIHPGYLAGFLISAYGQLQLTYRIHGGVVDEITSEDIYDILIPFPEREHEQEIGKMVSKAYDLKEMANIVEDQTIATLNSYLLGETEIKDAKELQTSLEHTFEVLLNYELVSPLTGKDFENELIPWKSKA